MFNLSGWEDREGGERRRLRGDEEAPVRFIWTGAKSEVSPRVMAGAIVFTVILSLQRGLILFAGSLIVGSRWMQYVLFFR